MRRDGILQQSTAMERVKKFNRDNITISTARNTASRTDSGMVFTSDPETSSHNKTCITRDTAPRTFFAMVPTTEPGTSFHDKTCAEPRIGFQEITTTTLWSGSQNITSKESRTASQEITVAELGRVTQEKTTFTTELGIGSQDMATTESGTAFQEKNTVEPWACYQNITSAEPRHASPEITTTYPGTGSQDGTLRELGTASKVINTIQPEKDYLGVTNQPIATKLAISLPETKDSLSKAASHANEIMNIKQCLEKCVKTAEQQDNVLKELRRTHELHMAELGLLLKQMSRLESELSSTELCQSNFLEADITKREDPTSEHATLSANDTEPTNFHITATRTKPLNGATEKEIMDEKLEKIDDTGEGQSDDRCADRVQIVSTVEADSSHSEERQIILDLITNEDANKNDKDTSPTILSKSQKRRMRRKKLGEAIRSKQLETPINQGEIATSINEDGDAIKTDKVDNATLIRVEMIEQKKAGEIKNNELSFKMQRISNNEEMTINQTKNVQACHLETEGDRKAITDVKSVAEEIGMAALGENLQLVKDDRSDGINMAQVRNKGINDTELSIMTEEINGDRCHASYRDGIKLIEFEQEESNEKVDQFTKTYVKKINQTQNGEVESVEEAETMTKILTGSQYFVTDSKDDDKKLVEVRNCERNCTESKVQHANKDAERFEGNNLEGIELVDAEANENVAVCQHDTAGDEKTIKIDKIEDEREKATNTREILDNKNMIIKIMVDSEKLESHYDDKIEHIKSLKLETATDRKLLQRNDAGKIKIDAFEAKTYQRGKKTNNDTLMKTDNREDELENKVLRTQVKENQSVTMDNSTDDSEIVIFKDNNTIANTEELVPKTDTSEKRPKVSNKEETNLDCFEGTEKKAIHNSKLDEQKQIKTIRRRDIQSNINIIEKTQHENKDNTYAVKAKIREAKSIHKEITYNEERSVDKDINALFIYEEKIEKEDHSEAQSMDNETARDDKKRESALQVNDKDIWECFNDLINAFLLFVILFVIVVLVFSFLSTEEFDDCSCLSAISK